MRSPWFVGALMVLSGWALPAWGQTKSDEAEPLRQQIRNKQARGSALEKPSLDTRRVTQLGVSRAGGEQEGEEDRLVVRIYDLSDLFLLAPSYPATCLPGLPTQWGDRSLFPSVMGMSSKTGVSGVGMGGMGVEYSNVQAMHGKPKTRPPDFAPTPHLPRLATMVPRPPASSPPESRSRS